MKVGVYNLYWTTFGGGEQMAGAAVDALSADHDVELLGMEPIDLDEARERLGVRLEGVTFRQVPVDGYAATLASTDYELFVNHTYRSMTPSLAPLGLYFVMFPHVLEPPASRRWVHHAGDRVGAPARLLGGVANRDGRSLIDGPTVVQVAPGSRSVRFVLSTEEHEDMALVQVGPGNGVAQYAIPNELDLTVELAPGSRNLDQVMLSPQALGDDRDETHYLVLEAMWVDGIKVDPSPRSWRQRVVAPRPTDFLRTYQRVVANSEYTRRWSLARWGRGDEVISPPVRMRKPGPKEQLIVSLGRFFGEDSGHSKRQLDLVRAFRSMVETGLQGWRLVLIGGCNAKDRDYAMAVRREASGLPVEVRLNAPGAVVDAHLAAASIYWHGAGYGSDLVEHPDRAEHFGIAPIEAMSAGAVPVVFDAGGPAAVINHDVDGFKWRTLEDLAALTQRLVDDVGLRTRLAAVAEARAREFDVAHSEQRVRDVVQAMVDEERGRASAGPS